MIPILTTVLSLLDKVFGYVSNVETTQLTTQAAVEEASIAATAQVETKWWFVAALIPIFALPYAIYDGKAVLWDNIIMQGHSSTPALHGSLDTLNWVIVTGLFLHAITKS
jgi:hypothetical protein